MKSPKNPRITAIIAALGLAIGLTACGTANAQEPSGEYGVPMGEPIQVGHPQVETPSVAPTTSESTDPATTDPAVTQAPVQPQPTRTQTAPKTPAPVTQAPVPAPTTQAPVPAPTTKPPTSTDIGAERAKSLCLAHFGVSSAKWISARQDHEDGRKEYEVDFVSGNFEYSCDIDALTGAIRDTDKESAYDDD
jgi:uncharacterized membrane protein YkoI